MAPEYLPSIGPKLWNWAETSRKRKETKYHPEGSLAKKQCSMKAEQPSTPPTPTTASNSQLIVPLLPRPRARRPKVLFHFVRHGHALCNTAPNATQEERIRTRLTRLGITNAPLSDLGRSQCMILQESLAKKTNITHILSSPLARTLETALLISRPITTRGVKIIAWDLLRELGLSEANVGDPLPVLREKMTGMPVDLSLLEEGWEKQHIHTNGQSYKAWENQRVDDAHDGLFEFSRVVIDGGYWEGIEYEKYEGSEDVEVLVVSHGNLLGKIAGPGFRNTEMRTFVFDTPDFIQIKR